MSYQRKPTMLVAREGYGEYVELGDVSSVLSSIGSGIKTIGGGLLGIVKGSAQSAGEASAYQQMAMMQAQQNQGMPSWVVPVAIGGVGLVAVLLLMKKRRK